MLARVQVQHELRQGAVQPRQRAVHDGEARAGDLAGGLAVQLAQRLPQRHVVLCGKIEFGRLAPAGDLDIVLLALPGRHLVGGQVGNPQQQVVELRLHLARLLGEPVQVRSDFFQGLVDLGLGVVDAHALPHQRADLLRRALALGEQVLGIHVGLFASRVQGAEALDIEFEAAFCQRGGDSLGILPHRLDIQHPDMSCIWLKIRRHGN